VDISHLGGGDTVGAVVALLDGAPDKARYRTYHVRTVSGGDDYGALLEVLRRRFRRGAEVEPGSGDQTWQLPDLFVIDGGRGQLAIALTAAGDLGIEELAIVGLAKEKETAQGEKVVDRVYLPGQKNPIALRPGSPELFFLARARDEAHRFANRGRSKLGQARRLASLLDPIVGVGPKTKKALFAKFESLEAMQAATDDELLEVPGVTAVVLAGLRQLFFELEGEPLQELEGEPLDSESPELEDSNGAKPPSDEEDGA
jgi:excinuclease ABC subunit C